MRKALTGLLTAGLMLASSVAVAQQKLEKLTITSGGDGMHYFPVYVARGGGFFAKEGIEVDWVNVGSGTRQAASVMGGSADMTPMALFHVIKARAEGADLVAIASLFDVYGMTVVLSNEAIAKAGITPGMNVDEKVKRLQGLKIGISSPGSSTDALIRSVLAARGYNPDKTVSLQPFGSGTSILAAFEKKLTDGVVYVAPIPETIEHRGLGKSVINPFIGEVPELNGVPYVIMATSRATLAGKRDLVARSMRALSKAMEFAHANPEATCKIVRPYFADLEESVFKLACETYRKATSRTPQLSRAQLDKTVAWMNIGAKAPIATKYEDVIANTP
jgi:NitT/TauT family transport system substrate-binding protein